MRRMHDSRVIYTSLYKNEYVKLAMNRRVNGITQCHHIIVPNKNLKINVEELKSHPNLLSTLFTNLILQGNSLEYIVKNLSPDLKVEFVLQLVEAHLLITVDETQYVFRGSDKLFGFKKLKKTEKKKTDEISVDKNINGIIIIKTTKKTNDSSIPDNSQKSKENINNSKTSPLPEFAYNSFKDEVDSAIKDTFKNIRNFTIGQEASLMSKIGNIYHNYMK